jgi:sterol desaturase/sphingolipid hydroxylase (fatty acid hydroxylase superfamily)
MVHAVSSVLAGCLVAEFAGYWLHVLMHSNKIEFLSRNHMIHHLLIYAPNKPQRQGGEYLLSTYGRASVLGLGLEWVLPVGLIVAALAAAMTALSVAALDRAIVLAAAMAWGVLMFWYMHDAMHLRGFWMEENRLLKRWFLTARRRHDIHHMDLLDDGRMTKNFGICLFFFDRLFGSLAVEHERFNPEGLQAARRRYAFIFATAPAR